MRHTQVTVGQRVIFNDPAATTEGTVMDALYRKHTKTGAARYRYRVQWDTGREEWLGAGELRLVTVP